MPSWYLVTLLRLGAVSIVAVPRLDVVRVLGVTSLLEVAYFFLWKEAIIAGYWRDAGVQVTSLQQFGEVFSRLFESGVIHALILVIFGRFSLFQAPNQPDFRIYKALSLVPLFWFIRHIQINTAYPASLGF